MDNLLKLWAREPALIVSAVRALLVCGVGFGLDLSAEQVTSIVLAMEAVFAMFTRASVYSPASVERIKEAAGAAPEGTEGDDAQ